MGLLPFDTGRQERNSRQSHLALDGISVPDMTCIAPTCIQPQSPALQFLSSTEYSIFRRKTTRRPSIVSDNYLRGFRTAHRLCVFCALATSCTMVIESSLHPGLGLQPSHYCYCPIT